SNVTSEVVSETSPKLRISDEEITAPWEAGWEVLVTDESVISESGSGSERQISGTWDKMLSAENTKPSLIIYMFQTNHLPPTENTCALCWGIGCHPTNGAMSKKLLFFLSLS
ncbi:hypothetical protein J0S82_013334, partial [Galemys pyrenaicus]